jgi:hypothetical protein
MKPFTLPRTPVYGPAFHLGREAVSRIEAAGFGFHPQQHIVRLERRCRQPQGFSHG